MGSSATYRDPKKPMRRVLLVHRLLTLPEAHKRADHLSDLLQTRTDKIDIFVTPAVASLAAFGPPNMPEAARCRWAAGVTEQVYDEPRFHAIVVEQPLLTVQRIEFRLAVKTALERNLPVQLWFDPDRFEKIQGMDEQGYLYY